MKSTALLGVLGLLLAAGCTKDDKSLESHLASIDSQLESLRGDMAELKKAGMVRGAAARGAARPPRPRGPDPQAVYAVPIDGAGQRGPSNAKVTMVKGFDFACPYCLRSRDTEKQLLEHYGNDLRVVYKNIIIHPGSATIPAHAACAANLQGKFPEMEDLIWDKGYKNGRNLSKENMLALARELGLDMTRFAKDMDGRCVTIVQQDMSDMTKVGARSTPAFFINGRYLSGARPIDQFEAIIDQELKKANDRLGKGAAQASYYRDWVLAKGKKTL